MQAGGDEKKKNGMAMKVTVGKWGEEQGKGARRETAS